MWTTIILSLVGIGATALTFIAAKNWKGEAYLCDDCKFNNPESCHKAERPKAVICYAYRKKDSTV